MEWGAPLRIQPPAFRYEKGNVRTRLGQRKHNFDPLDGSWIDKQNPVAVGADKVPFG
jgi:hypothetical protein